MWSLLSTERLARVSARRPWLTLGVWVALVIVGGFLAMGVGDVVTTDQATTVELESDRADRLLEESGLQEEDTASELVIVQSTSATVDDPAYRAYVDDLVTGIRGLDEAVTGAVSFYETGAQNLVSEDRRTLLIPVTLIGEEEADEAIVLIDYLDEAATDGFAVLTVGDGSMSNHFNETAERDLQTAEVFGLPIALIVLAVVFGALVAAGIPIILALISIIIAVGATAVLGQQFELSIFVVNVTTMMGLAVGIDYALFVVERFREERRAGSSVEESVAIAGGTASRAVLFSGLTVIVALAGLLIIPDTIYRSVAAGAIIVVIVAVLGALTLLPAILRLLGDRVNWLKVPFVGHGGSSENGFWSRVASMVMARPVASVVLATSLLLAAALPYATIKLGFAGVSTLSEDSDVYQAFQILDEEFSAGLIEPVEVVVNADDVNDSAVQAAIDEMRADIAEDDRFGASTVEISSDGTVALVSFTIAGDPQADAAYAALDDLRADYIAPAFDGVDAGVQVTGETAGTDDYFELIDRYTPIVFAFVLGLSFVVLLVVFRSIVVPIKAMIMNLLSVGAAYGLLVLVFQYGVGNELLGFQQIDRTEAWVPLFLFAVLFGLSMDYHVFLLSRIRERFEETGDNRESIAFGVRSTASIITGAALIMVAVFAGFAQGELVAFQQMGFGLAIAVIIDATIVRSVLVPASMVLLGDRNWYLPSWLNWLPHVQVEGPRRPHHGGTSYAPASAAER